MSLSLPVSPLPYPDELISSWVGRAACRYGMTGSGLIAALRARRPDYVPRYPIDWRADPRDLEALAAACHVDPNVLRDRELAATGWPRRWFAWDGLPGIDEPAAWGDTAPAFCRRCWREDVAAGRDSYLRRGWARVLGMCQTHRQPLSRSCGWCGAACAPRHPGRLTMQQGLARRVCESCGHFLEQRPPPARIADPTDPLWRYAREPVPPEIAAAIGAAWCEVAAFEAGLATALDGLAALPVGADCVAAGFVRAVADLARLWLKPSGENGRPLIAGCGTPAFPVPTLGCWRPRGGAASLAVAGLAVRQAVLAAIAEMLRPSAVAAADAPSAADAIIAAAWRLDLARFVRLLDDDGRVSLERRAAAWPPALQRCLAAALRDGGGAAYRAAPRRPDRHPPQHGWTARAAPLREPEPGDSPCYRRLASAVLTSAAWQQARGRSRRVRHRILGRLMRRALLLAPCGGMSHDPGAVSRE
jgi:TniQ